MSSASQSRVSEADPRGRPEGVVTVHLWAGAKAAAGAGEVVLEVPGPVSVAWVTEAVVRRHEGRERLPQVLSVCSVLVGDRPLGADDPSVVTVQPGGTVEYLPPFAGG